MGIYDSITGSSSNTPNTTPSTSIYAKVVNPVSSELQKYSSGSSLYGPTTYTPIVNSAPVQSSFDRMKQNASDSVVSFGNAVLHPLDTLKAAPQFILKPFVDAYTEEQNTMNKIVGDYIDGKGNTATNVANTLRLFSSFANIALSPITLAFNTAEQIPGLKQVAKTLAVPPTLGGATLAVATGKAIDVLPENVVSKETKDILKQPVVDFANLFGQIFIGGKLFQKMHTVMNTKGTITPQDARTMVSEVMNDPNLPPNVPSTDPAFQNYAKSKFSTEVPVTNKVRIPTTETVKTEVVKETTPQTSPETFQSETNLKFVQQAEAAGIPISSDVPQLERMSNVKSLKAAQQIVATDLKRALRILDGLEKPPPETQRSAIYVELSKLASTDLNPELIQKLSRTSVGTDPARELQMLNNANTLFADPVTAAREIGLTRAKVAEGRGIKIEKAVKEARQKVEKIQAPSRMSWEEFIRSIEC